jgi:hypothetical protein
MAFAAARMIMPKDKQARKASAELPGNRNKVSAKIECANMTRILEQIEPF